MVYPHILHSTDQSLAASWPRLAFDDYVTQIYQRQNFSVNQNFLSIRKSLQAAYATPLNLNKVTLTQLAQLGILSDNQLRNFFFHRTTTGDLYSTYELQAIPDFDLITIRLLLPFICVPENYSTQSSLWKKIMESKNNYFLFRYEPSFHIAMARAPNKGPLGNLDKYTLQLMLKSLNAMRLGITARKQPGESFCWDHNTHRYGFNLWSIFLSIESIKYIKKLIIGDYIIGYGQGLLLNTEHIRGTKHDITSIISSHNMGILPYKGIQRTGCRGLAITSVMGPIEITGFYATNHPDAALHLDTRNRAYANQIDYTGIYNTMHKLHQKGTIHEQLTGCTIRAQYHKKQTEVGITLLYNQYDHPIIPKENSYSRYLFKGQSCFASSLFYRLLWKNITLFGENGITCIDPTLEKILPEKAMIIGCIMSLSRYAAISSAIYHYGTKFYNPYGNAFKHYRTDHANEKGTYIGIELTPLIDWKILVCNHLFTTLRPKPQLITPHHGYILTTRCNYTFSRVTLLIIQYTFNKIPKNKFQAKPINPPPTTKEIAYAHKNNFKLKLAHQPTPYWGTKIEVQLLHHTFLVHKNFAYSLSNSQKWKTKAYQFIYKISYFNTQDYGTRIYIHEPIPLYSSKIFTPHYGTGLSVTLLICWQPIKWMRLEAKYNGIYRFSALPIQSKINKPVPTNQQKVTIQLILHF